MQKLMMQLQIVNNNIFLCENSEFRKHWFQRIHFILSDFIIKPSEGQYFIGKMQANGKVLSENYANIRK